MRQELNANGPFRTLVLEAKPLRKKLLSSADLLWGEHPELGDVVLAIRKGQGYLDMADDLGALHELFKDQRAEAENRCPGSAEHLRRGLENVRDAAKYVFRNDATALERYPSLFVLRRRPRPGSSTGSEATTSVDQTPSDQISTVGEPPAGSADPPIEDLEASAPDA